MATKKSTNGDHHCTYYLKVRAVTIADYLICQPVLLDRDQKFAIVVEGNSHYVIKLASLCSSSVCFFGCFKGIKKLGLLPRKNIWHEALHLDPLTSWILTLSRLRWTLLGQMSCSVVIHAPSTSAVV
jgi:hypothetical protein